jgi:hypothetical protein
VLEIFSQKKKKENETCENVTRLKGTKFKDHEDALVIRIGQVNVKNGTASHEVVKEKVKVIGQQMGVTNSGYRTGTYFAPKNVIRVKMNTV